MVLELKTIVFNVLRKLANCNFLWMIRAWVVWANMMVIKRWKIKSWSCSSVMKYFVVSTLPTNFSSILIQRNRTVLERLQSTVSMELLDGCLTRTKIANSAATWPWAVASLKNIIPYYAVHHYTGFWWMSLLNFACLDGLINPFLATLYITGYLTTKYTICRNEYIFSQG